MKFFYKFWNLLGTVYRKGNLIFSPDGNSVISPVGNKISIYDLKNNKARTLDIESRFNYTCLDISPNGMIIVAVNEEGEAHFISLQSRTIIRKYRFNGDVACIKFSPNGKYFAASKGNNVFVFKAFGNFTGELNPFEMLRVFHNAQDDVTCLEWSSDSKVLAAGSKDTSVKLYPLERFSNFKSYSLGSHKDTIVNCFFENDSLDIYSISKDSLLCVWECSLDLDGLKPEETVKRMKINDDGSESEDDVKEAEQEEEEVEKEETVQRIFYKRITRMFLSDSLKKDGVGAVLTSAAYHRNTHILVSGYSTGIFSIHELPSITLIHSLSISEHDVTAVSLNNTGDWIALGSSTLGQLLVWEWQSETYVMKQQGHHNNMTCLTYSPDGMYIATGGYDGKVKLWNTSTGFCFVTFTEHSSSITSLKFSNNRKFVVSASLDGTVRAFDMTRYRNFKTFTSPRPVQFACVAVDSNGEFIAAGCQDVFEIYLWSMKIGRLCEILSGHEGPVVSLAFDPNLGITTLASVSWDKTLRIWNAIESGSEHETFQLPSDGLAVAYRPDGEEVAVATLNSQITFINVSKSMQTGSVEGRNDLGSGVLDTDKISAKQNLAAKAFNSLCYTADGSCILAGGNSKNVCIYNVKEAILIKKFVITQNRSLDGIDDFINRRKLTEFGNVDLIEERDGEANKIRLPGVRQGDMAARSSKPEIRIYQLEFSPTGQAWAVATTEGLLIYSLDLGLVFDPFQLDFGITPETVKETVKDEDYPKAIMMSIKLGEKNLIQYVLEHVPSSHIPLCVQSIANCYIPRCIKFIVEILENTTHLEFYLIWIKNILTTHGKNLKNPDSLPALVALQKNLIKSFEELEKICDYNKYTLQFLSRVGDLKLAKGLDEIKDEEMGSEEEDDPVQLLAK